MTEHEGEELEEAPQPDSGLTIAGSSSIGRRAANQDEVIALTMEGAQSPWGLRGIVGVADGMGGHPAGEVASKLAADTVTEVLGLTGAAAEPPAEESSDTEPAEVIAGAVRLANSRIYERAQANEAERDMGTTLTLVAFTHDTAFVAHIGDSRG